MNNTYTISGPVEPTTLTLDDIYKTKALFDNIEDPWKLLFERHGFSIDTDVLFLPGPIVDMIGVVPKCVVSCKFISDGYFMKGDLLNENLLSNM